MSRPLPEAELLEAVNLVPDWSPLRGARIFITGGTGFFGKWLLEVLGTANKEMDLKARVVVLSRNPDRFLREMPHLAQAPWLSFQEGDASDFTFPEGAFTHIIHGAGSSDARDYTTNPSAMRRTLVEGTNRAMAFATQQADPRVLFLSSGAVYGPQPPELTHLPDDHPLPLDTDEPAHLYAQCKREAERIVSEAATIQRIPCPIARCFAFAGPHLPLDQHFAFGNFIRDALAGSPIHIAGDGTARRSYLYASELAAWLWTLAISGRSTTYNVGSDADLNIRELAEAVASASGTEIHRATVPRHEGPPTQYVPSVRRMHLEFGLSPTVNLNTAIARTLHWHQGS